MPERWRRHEIAHFLYCPTMLGHHVAVARWHHCIHLIPGWMLNRLCDRHDRALGLYDDEMDRLYVSRRWAEDWDCPEDGVYDG